MLFALKEAGFEFLEPSGGIKCWVDLGRPIASTVTAQMNSQGYSIAPVQRFGLLPTSNDEISDMVRTLAHHVENVKKNDTPKINQPLGKV